MVGWFNDRINARDLDGLAELMHDEHVFIDSEGGTVTGKKACLEAWQGFFASFPDYRNVFGSMIGRPDQVIALGHSECSEPALAGPALWSAIVRDGLVAQWRVYADTPDIRTALGLSVG